MKTPDRERLNFRRFVSPERKKEMAPFDVEKEITQVDLLKCKEDVDDNFSSGLIDIALLNAPYLKILDTSYTVTDEHIAVIRDFLNRLKSGRTSSSATFPEHLANAKLLAPDAFSTPAEADIQYVMESLRNVAGENSEITLIASAKILNVPELDAMIDQVCTPELIMGVLKEMSRNGPWNLAHQAASLKILNIPFVLSDSDWASMKAVIKENQRMENQSGRFMELAANMKIIAAEEVKVTDKGLEITMRKERAAPEVVPPVPAVSHLP